MPCNAHAPYCHLWPARLYIIFAHYLINGTIFEREREIEREREREKEGGREREQLLNIKCVF